jgi:shikimate dehydrogenase
VLGTGGTARTLGFALALSGNIQSLTIAGRNSEKVNSLARDIEHGCSLNVATSSLEPTALMKTLDACTLLVNCTSVGMHPNSDASPLPGSLLRKGMTVFDTIYNPQETQLIAMAKEAGCQAQNGLRMLVYQGLASFKLWTGITVDESIYDFDELQDMVNM